MKNADQQIPVSQVMKQQAIIYSFPMSKPIYWGPGQVTVFPDTYNEPDKTQWKKNFILQIPRVARFFFGDGGNNGGGGGPCDGGSTGVVKCYQCVEIIFPGLDHFDSPRDRDRRWVAVSGGGGEIYERPSRWNVDEGGYLSFHNSKGEYTTPDDPDIHGLVACTPSPAGPGGGS